MFSPIDEILAEVRAGRPVLLLDDADASTHGDLMIAAEDCDAAMINFMSRSARGVICLALTDQRCEKLRLHPQTEAASVGGRAAFTVTVDAHPRFSVSGGGSARDRAITIAVAIAEDSQPHDLQRPGHVHPVRAREGGVLVRAGQTEASIDLARLADKKPAAVICEVLRDDGEVASRDDLQQFSREHGFKVGTIADLISYRLKREQFVKRIQTITLPTRWGEFRLFAFQSMVDPQPHLALCKGGIGELDVHGQVVPHPEPVLVRVHSECLTGDIFGSAKCDCGDQLSVAIQRIEREGKGVLLYLRQEGRGIGLANKLHAYALQEQGLDTVEANVRLGLPIDKRDYGIGSQILRDLGLTKIRIMTNNPKKIYGIEGFGLHVTEEIPVRIEPGEHNKRYLDSKREKMGHRL